MLKSGFEEIRVLVHEKIKVASVKIEVLNSSLKVELTLDREELTEVFITQ